MKKFFFLTILTLGFISCEKDNIENEIHNEKIGNENFLEKSSASNDKYWTDITGRIEIIETFDVVHSTDPVISSNINYIKHTTRIPEGYVCIGGAAQVSRSGSGVDPNSPGALLTISAPTTGSDEYKGWSVEAKAHLYGGYEIKLTVGAIGIRLKDDDGNYIPVNVLKESLRVFSNTSSVASHPSTSVSVSNGYKMIGGGAKVNWSGAGNLLTASYPEGNSWNVKSKDHGVSSPASITAYAIGIKNIIPNFGSLDTMVISDCRTVITGDELEDVSFPWDSSYPYNTEYGITSPGGKSTFNGAGRMLTGIGSNLQFAAALSKDHGWADSGQICTYTIGVKKE